MNKLEMLENQTILSHVISHMHNKPSVVIEVELKPESMNVRYAEGNLINGPIKEAEISNKEVYEYLENELFLKLINSELVESLSEVGYYLINFSEIGGRITQFTVGYEEEEVAIFTRHGKEIELQSVEVSSHGEPIFISKVLLNILAM